MIVGYLRVSTIDQTAGFEAQRAELVATGCKKLFEEQISSIAPRAQLEAALDFVREGDVFTVTKLDRLARSVADLLRIVERLDEKGVGLRILDFGGTQVETKSPSGRLLLTMLAAIAQWEREMMLARQREGIAAAKAQGRYKGRVPTARKKSAEVCKLHEEGVGASTIAARLGIGRASVYRIIETGKQAGAT